jgi:general secretion pathway protein I
LNKPSFIAQKSNRGFSLLEILVAFVILALSLGALLGVFSRGLTTASMSSHYSEAAIIAESKLAEAGIVQPLEEASYGGETGIYNWYVNILPYSWPVEDVDPALTNNVTDTFQIDIDVSWRQGARPMKIHVTSLQLKAE